MEKEYPYTQERNGDKTELRPYIDVELIHGEKRRTYTDALVDSGAESTLINLPIATRLGINLEDCLPVPVSGAGGIGNKGYETTIRLNIVDFKYEYPTKVIFTPIPATIILGADFFDRFRIYFERDQKIFWVTAVPSLKF
ncbi:MAG TPA: retropepsin-like aspartic protease [Candidatus Paceibacterota bacterium]|nr:retropepsin-like aspartic protease [Candidatus Paceibacterota bacterium]